MTIQPEPDADTQQRQRWMAVLARAPLADLQACLQAAPPLPHCATLRAPEAGMVMLRGRAGGTGRRFNLGEMVVTRCTVRSAAGHVGHACVAGREPARADLAARLDAAMQDAALRPALERAVIAPLALAQAAAREAVARRAAATRVEFFTMATMR